MATAARGSAGRRVVHPRARARLPRLVLPVCVGVRAEAWFMVCVALVPFVDTAIVLRNGGTKGVAFGIHFVAAIVVLVSAGPLLAV